MISRAANMRLLSRALAFAVLVAGATLPNASNAQVVPAIKGGGSQINVYGTYTLVKTDFNSALDYPPKAPPPSSFNERMAGTRVFPPALISAWGGSCLVSRRSGARFTYSAGTTGNKEPSCSAPNFTTSTSRFRPYGDFLIGPGNITYSTGQTDNSIVYEFGGGVDYHKNRG